MTRVARPDAPDASPENDQPTKPTEPVGRALAGPTGAVAPPAKRWERQVGGVQYGAELRLDSVLFDEVRSPHEGGGIHVSHAAVISGRIPHDFGAALGDAILGEVRAAIRAWQDSPEGRAHAQCLARWRALPVDSELAAVDGAPDEAAHNTGRLLPALDLHLPGAGLLEIRDRTACFAPANGPIRELRLSARARAGLAIDGAYWLITDRLQVFDANGDPALDPLRLAADFGFPDLVWLQGIARRGADVVIRYTSRAAAADSPIAEATGVAGLVRVDRAASTLTAVFRRQRHANR